MSLSKIFVNNQDTGFEGIPLQQMGTSTTMPISQKASTEAIVNRFISFDTSVVYDWSKLAKFIVYLKIENPKEGYRYALSAILNYSEEIHHRIYFDEYLAEDPTQKSHLGEFILAQDGVLCKKTWDNTSISIIVNWKGLNNISQSWGQIWIDFSDYAYSHQELERLVEDWPTQNSEKIVTSHGIHIMGQKLRWGLKTLSEPVDFNFYYEEPYSPSDGYSVYITGVEIRTSMISPISINDLGIETVTSPDGKTSIKIPNYYVLIYDTTDFTYKVVREGIVNPYQITLFTNHIGRGVKATIGKKEKDILQKISANLDKEDIDNLRTISRSNVDIYALETLRLQYAEHKDYQSGLGYLIGRDTYEGTTLYHKSTKVFRVYDGDTIHYKGRGDYNAKSGIFLAADGKTELSYVQAVSGNFYTPFAVPSGAYYAQFSSYDTRSVEDVTLDIIYESKIDKVIRQLDENKAGLIHSVNLFNKNDSRVREGFYNSGYFPNYPTYHLSHPIWCKADKTYFVTETTGEMGENTEAVLSDEYGNFNGKIYGRIADERSFAFDIAKDCYIMFNLGHSNYEGRAMVCEGSLPETYVPYVSKLDNSVDLNNHQLDQVLEIIPSSQATSIRISIQSSDKVGFFSNSFLEGYAMLGKHAIEKLMMFCDYLPYNYSKSGDDMIEEAYRLDKDQTFLGVCKPSEVGPVKYGIIMHQDNDGIVFNSDHRTYYENAKKLGYEIMSLGGQPIISTEHDWRDNYLIFQRLCQDEGWQFVNWGKVYNDIPIGQYDPMWHSHHPATRSNWCQVHGFLPIIEALPRPVQSIKLFRLRSFVDSSNLKNTLYNTILERAERWIELHNGQTGIKSGQEAKFDRFGEYQVQTYGCEYQNLIKNISTSFGSHLLADITTPYNVRSISKFTLNIIGTGIARLYARQIRYMDDSWLPSASSQYIAFGITAGENLLNVGDTITISGITRTDGTDLNQNYTISGIANGYIITTESGANHTTSGTDNPTCNVSGVILRGSYKYPSGAYIENYNKPLGQWTEISFADITGGISVDLTSSQIEKFGAADKFVFMATGTNIAITDIYADVVGSNLKERHEKSIIIPEPKIGQSALSTTTFTTADTAWENLSNIPVVTPVTDGTYTEYLPGTTREIPTNGWVAQQLDTTKFAIGQYKKPLRIQIQILARWFPKYILTDADYETSELTPDSFDMAKLEVQLNTSACPSDNAQFPVTTMYIGAWWNVYVFEMDLIGAPTWLTLKCVDKRVQIAKCDLVVVE